MEEWQKQFYDKYVNGKLNEAMSLVYKNMPSSFIKFYSGTSVKNNNYSLKALKDETLWMSSPNEFNDPFDCPMCIGEENVICQILEYIENCGINQFKDKVLNNINKDLKNKSEIASMIFNKQLRDIREQLFVSCLTDINNLQSSVMWAHYANSHKGFCIEYDSRKMRELNYEYIPIKYSALFEPSWMYSFHNSNNKLIFNTVYVKSSEWSYEKEWRFHDTNKKYRNQKGYAIKVSGTIKNVYLGYRVSKNLEKEILKVCRDKKINVYKMKMKNNSFQLQYELIEDKKDSK